MGRKKIDKFIVSERGQWDYPGQPTVVPTEDGSITMEGVPYPVMGYVPGYPPVIMQPGGNYQFPGNMVYEIPMVKHGGWLDRYQDGSQVVLNDPQKVEEKKLKKIQADKYGIDVITPGEHQAFVPEELRNKYDEVQRKINVELESPSGRASFEKQLASIIKEMSAQNVDISKTDYMPESVKKAAGLPFYCISGACYTLNKAGVPLKYYSNSLLMEDVKSGKLKDWELDNDIKSIKGGDIIQLTGNNKSPHHALLVVPNTIKKNENGSIDFQSYMNSGSGEMKLKNYTWNPETDRISGETAQIIRKKFPNTVEPLVKEREKIKKELETIDPSYFSPGRTMRHTSYRPGIIVAPDFSSRDSTMISGALDNVSEAGKLLVNDSPFTYDSDWQTLNKTAQFEPILEKINNPEFKKEFMKQFNISDREYNATALYALGEYGQETGFGTKTKSMIENDSVRGLDSKWQNLKSIVSGKGRNVKDPKKDYSRGLTQVKLRNIPREVREKYNLTPETLDTDPVAAITAAMSVNAANVPTLRKVAADKRNKEVTSDNYLDYMPYLYNQRSRFLRGDKKTAMKAIAEGLDPEKEMIIDPNSPRANNQYVKNVTTYKNLFEYMPIATDLPVVIEGKKKFGGIKGGWLDQYQDGAEVGPRVSNLPKEEFVATPNIPIIPIPKGKPVQVPGVSGSMKTVYIDDAGNAEETPEETRKQMAMNEMARSNNIDPIGMAILAASGAAPAARTISAALPFLEAPLTVGSTTVPGLTAGNLLGAAGAGYSTSQVLDPESDLRTNPNATNIAETALGFMGVGIANQSRMGLRSLQRGLKQLPGSPKPISAVDDVGRLSKPEVSINGRETNYTYKNNKGEEVGSITFVKSDRGFEVLGVEVNDKLRRQGYAEEIYNTLNKEANTLNKTVFSEGNFTYSSIKDGKRIAPAKNLWEKLINNNKAVLTHEKTPLGIKKQIYRMNIPSSVDDVGRGLESGNVNLRLWNIFNKKKPEPFLPPSLNAEAELARANADALAFSQSPYNKVKLREFRPNQDFNVTNTEALFHNDPLAREKFSKLMKDDPDFLNYRNTENWQGAAEGNYGARNFGDMDDLAIVNKHKPQSKIYNAAIHETGHSRSVRLPATKEERAILDDAWQGLKDADGSSLPVLEAEAVQGELRMLLGDKLGKRVYTKADEAEIKTALEKMIADNHPYMQNINVFDISKIIKSLNKIGLASVVGIGTIGAGALQEKKYGGWLDEFDNDPPKKAGPYISNLPQNQPQEFKPTPNIPVHPVNKGYKSKQVPGVLGSMTTVYENPDSGEVVQTDRDIEKQQASMDMRGDADRLFNDLNPLTFAGSGAFYGASNIAQGNVLEGVLEAGLTSPLIPRIISKSKQLPGSANTEEQLMEDEIKRILRKNVTHPKVTGPANEPGLTPNKFLYRDDKSWSADPMLPGRTSVPEQRIEIDPEIFKRIAKYKRENKKYGGWLDNY